ncbi:MAG: UbiD family decarboxylase [Leptospirales bacterium]|nr:UbiD family decarboxylase [Leptospirales bacterium]
MQDNLHSFIELLKKERELKVIEALVDPYLEIAEIQRRVVAESGPALLFTNVKGSAFPVATNLIGSRKRVELVMGDRPGKVIKNAAEAASRLMPPSVKKLWQERDWLFPLRKTGFRSVGRRSAPVLEHLQAPTDLTKLPALTSWPGDGGAFVTLPLVYTEHPETGLHNLGMYRVQIKGKDLAGMHWQIHKGGGFHHSAAEQKNQALPLTLFIGGPMALTVAAITALPEYVPELLYASFLMNDKLNLVKVNGHPHPLIAEADFAVCGEVPPKIREDEGPFGDHYGYYSLAHPFPVFQVKKIYHRKNAVFPATVVGKPRQEDYYIGEWMQELLAPMFPLIMPGVRQLWNYAETGYHSLTAAIVRETYSREALAHGFRILGEGQLSLTKILMLTDAPVDLKDFKQLLITVLERFSPERDLVIIGKTSMDTLDYTGRMYNEGSKAIIMGTGEKKRTLPKAYAGKKIPGIKKIEAYCHGCLTVSGRSYKESPKLGEKLAADKDNLGKWPFVILVDDTDDVYDTAGFLWTVFTRFDPAWDIHATKSMRGNSIEYRFPIVIDARMKPWYPGELVSDEAVVKRVDKRWKEFF